MNTAAILQLLRLADALAPLGVPIRTGRRLIHEGKLPATKIGREFFVDPADVAELFKPRVLVRAKPKGRESNSAREERLLEGAGIAPK